MTTTLKRISFFALAIVLLSSLNSCYKKKDTIARITVLDSAGAAVPSAEVRLYYDDDGNPDNNNIDQTATTNVSGTASFNFNEVYKAGQAGLAVLDIEVNGNFAGVIKVEAEMSNEKTVEI